MSMQGRAQFTPGPWYAHLAKADHCLSSSVWGQEPGNQVAVIGGKSLQAMNANATLIAAAPAMYEALQEIDDQLDQFTIKAQEELGLRAALLKIRAALAQAEGR